VFAQNHPAVPWITIVAGVAGWGIAAAQNIWTIPKLRAEKEKFKSEILSNSVDLLTKINEADNEQSKAHKAVKDDLAQMLVIARAGNVSLIRKEREDFANSLTEAIRLFSQYLKLKQCELSTDPEGLIEFSQEVLVLQLKRYRKWIQTVNLPIQLKKVTDTPVQISNGSLLEFRKFARSLPSTGTIKIEVETAINFVQNPGDIQLPP
jgi:hypothetical protein